jgi:hypothetical protein
VVADLEKQGDHDVGQGREPAMPGPELADLGAVTQSAARSRGRKYSAGSLRRNSLSDLALCGMDM